jgi:hypothetical protein
MSNPYEAERGEAKPKKPFKKKRDKDAKKKKNEGSKDPRAFALTRMGRVRGN